VQRLKRRECCAGIGTNKVAKLVAMETFLSPDACWPLALALMQRAVGMSDPNPRVGCVLVNPQGQVIGEGHTQQAGGPHAEVMALRDAQSRGMAVQGATAYVTLEPCAHTGRTPPCADALVAAQVARVVVALPDPNPLVAGQGVARLQAAGMEVTVLPSGHPAAMASRELNIGFLSRMVRKRPWVRVKMAASLDGRTALPDGRSQWITSESARADGHVWRARASAILTGIGTVLADNPRLDVRGVPVARQPWRVVLDSHWRTPPQAALFDAGAGAGDVWLVGLAGGDAQAQARQAALQTLGAQVLALPADSSGQHPDLNTLMPLLAARGVNEVHVEAGARLNGALIEGGWADEWLVYLAPKLLGEGRGLANVSPTQDLQLPPAWAWREATLVNDNVRLLARRIGADSF
jgi:diaminohydroxyphosphoribosylaminopyrimidine deaminase/5-amino-6-(5-phosphoribosylamino)uracil reductase